jgi:hypothetical protein
MTPPARRPAKHAVKAAARYVGEQFPPAQAAALGVGCGVEYLGFGQTSGHISIAVLTLVAAVTVPIFFLQLRLVDDIHTFYDSDGTGDIGGATVRGLVVAFCFTALIVIALNATHVRDLAWAIAIMCLMVATSGILRVKLPGWFRMMFGRLPLFELAPALMLAYVYITWSTATGRSLPLRDVLSVVGLFWTAFNVWKLSRHMGELERERIYLLRWPEIRLLCLALLGLSAFCAVKFAEQASLSPIFLAYMLGLCALFAVFSRPRRVADSRRPGWVGLPFPTVLIAGLLVQLLLLT